MIQLKKGDGQENEPVEIGVQKIIQKLDIKTLQDIVTAQALKDQVFRNTILRFVRKEKGGANKDTYAGEIRDSIESYAGRHGYVEWRDVSDSMSAAEDLSEEVTENIDEGDYEEAFAKIGALLETLYPALQEVDDSNGDVGSIIENTWFEFNRLSKVLPDELKREVYDFCLSSAKSDIYSGWLVESDFYEIASEMIQDENMKNTLLKELQNLFSQKKEDKYSSEYQSEKIVRIQQTIFEKSGSTEDLEKLLEKNIHIPGIRRDFIKKALEKNDYGEAEKLAHDGIRIANKNKHPGTVTDFQKILLDIALQSKNEEDQKHWTLELFLSRNEFEYFKQLKQLYKKDSSEWLQVRDEIIGSLSKNSYSSSVFYKIFEEESMWSVFSERIEKELGNVNSWGIQNDSGGLRLLDSHFCIIWERFPEKASKWYIESARRAFQMASTRNSYQSNLKLIKRVSSVPIGNEILIEIRKELREKYKNRKALLEEMNAIL